MAAFLALQEFCFGLVSGPCLDGPEFCFCVLAFGAVGIDGRKGIKLVLRVDNLNGERDVLHLLRKAEIFSFSGPVAAGALDNGLLPFLFWNQYGAALWTKHTTPPIPADYLVNRPISSTNQILI